MILDFLYGSIGVLAVLLLWELIEHIAESIHFRRQRKRRDMEIDAMIQAWRNKDREFMQRQRKIRGDR